MRLRDLLAPWFHYAGDERINNMSLNSRTISNGDLFVAIPGHQIDGRKYIASAFENGATAALVHTDDPTQHGQVSQVDGMQIAFFQLSRQVSALAAQAYPLSQQRPKLIAVTGTNGKTSVTQLIAQIEQLMQHSTAVMGTLGNGIWGDLVESGNTTADPITLMRQLKFFETQAVHSCAMEVSSHGLVQGRVEAVPFDVAVFTNLSRDHLDYHETMEAYGAAKQRLFHYSSLRTGLINLDDAVGAVWLEEFRKPNHMSFSALGNPQANIYARDVCYHGAGVTATLVYPEGEVKIASPLLGAFNLSNLIAALGALYLLGQDMTQMAPLVTQLEPVAGRMECFETTDNKTLVVDYAHTPDALEQALKALRVHCSGQLWCVFGCGGDRDTGKRALMAQAAEQFADKVVVTSDNARSEDPQAIIDQVVTGLTKPEQAITVIDREQAIRQAAKAAQAGDMILLAGKGHETYQEIQGQRIAYDERALAQELAGGQA